MQNEGKIDLIRFDILTFGTTRTHYILINILCVMRGLDPEFHAIHCYNDTKLKLAIDTLRTC